MVIKNHGYPKRATKKSGAGYKSKITKGNKPSYGKHHKRMY